MRREKVLSMAAAVVDFVVLKWTEGSEKEESSDTHTVQKVALRRRNAERESPFAGCCCSFGTGSRNQKKGRVL
jgi:hypothetical protein